MITLPFTIERDTLHDLPITWIFTHQFVTNSILFTINAGSLYESDEFLPEAVNGIFHFLEHQVFTLASGEDVMALLTQYVSNINAFSSREKTCFYAHFIKPDPEILRIMLKLVFEAKRFSKMRVEKEKKIIQNELITLLDDPLYESYESWNRLVFENYPVWRIPLGKADTIQQITPEKLKIAHTLFYHPKQSDLLILTNQSKSFWMTALDMLTQLEINPSLKRIELTIPPDPDNDKGASFQECTVMTSVPYFMAGWKPLRQEFSFRDGIIGDMLSQIIFGSIAKIQDDWMSQSLIDDSFMVDWDWDHRYGCWYIAGYSRNPKKIIDLTRMEMKKRHQIGIRKNEFNIIKRHFLANNLLEAYYPREFVFEMQNLTRFGLNTWEEYFALIQSISWDELNESLPRFMPEKQFKSSILLPGLSNV